MMDARKRGIPESQVARSTSLQAAVKLQEEAGLSVVTDGEMRGESFQS